MSELVRYEVRGRAGWITLDSPDNRNALSAALVEQLGARLREAHADPALRAVVLTGTGRAFCAGADLKSRGDMGGGGGENPFVGILRSLRDGPKPVIAAVNGHAFGGGIGLVAAADIAVGVDSARFAFSEVRVGAIPAMISVVVLPVLGVRQTMRLFLTGERFDAGRARELGLLHQVVEAGGLAGAVEAQVEAIAQGAPGAVAEAKRLVRTIPTLPEAEAFAWAERKIAEIFASPEAAEGMAAFAARRPPKWTE